MDPIVIVGTGLAGYTVARELRKLDADTPLVMITADDGRFYSKPNLSNGYGLGKQADELAMSDAQAMAQQLHAAIHTDARVEALEIQQRRVILADRSQPYSRLVLALGADPIALPLEGDGADAVLSVNDLQDYGRFRAAMAGGRRLVILGAGLIGCEFANDLQAAGVQVALVDPADEPLGRLAPPPVGRALREALAGIGVEWHMGTVAQRIERQGEDLRASLADGARLDAGVVLSAVGLRPRVALAQTAGLTTERGIVVDRLLRTSAANVYALGDCAEVAGLVLPFVMPIMHAARALARTLTGTATEVRYPAMPVVVKTPALPVVVAPPAAGAAGAWRVETIDGGVRARWLAPGGDRLLGFALAGTAVAEKQALTKLLPPTLK
ncbi:MAG: FAD-dependent oxidoreductase [Gammaproteobacteria bacterium]|jgi:rubredoxin---NAD+ reductase